MTTEATTEARHTLPADHYYSPEQYAVEQEHLWYEQWVYVGEPSRSPSRASSSPSTSRARASLSPATTTAAPCVLQRLQPPRGHHLRGDRAARPRPSSSARTTPGATT